VEAARVDTSGVGDGGVPKGLNGDAGKDGDEGAGDAPSYGTGADHVGGVDKVLPGEDGAVKE
ncbi:MAG: hypothetical protein LQ341_001562, partial [Variospora aurantia]